MFGLLALVTDKQMFLGFLTLLGGIHVQQHYVQDPALIILLYYHHLPVIDLVQAKPWAEGRTSPRSCSPPSLSSPKMEASRPDFTQRLDRVLKELSKFLFSESESKRF